MRIIVCVKQVYDPKTVKISRSREELDLRDAIKILNPPDKYALEAGLRLRETAGGEVIALTVGGPEAEDVAHEAVAIGADKGILVTGGTASSFQLPASSVVTSLLASAIGRLNADLVLTGHSGHLGRHRQPGPAPGRRPGLAGGDGRGAAGFRFRRSDGGRLG